MCRTEMPTPSADNNSCDYATIVLEARRALSAIHVVMVLKFSPEPTNITIVACGVATKIYAFFENFPHRFI